MLKLKRVEIHGFKSFYDRTEMKFSGQGIAAVVGPNGCGKSNLSDAINWVLGEQSAKTLRGARMEDVIFAGTRERKALGMATVTMTLVADHSRLREPVHAAAVPAISEPVQDAPEQSSEDTHQPLVASDEPASAHPTKAEAEKAAERSGEITITRRLYRSGESEYLINGKIARLRDIQDLFLGTGLGPESYAIIEQGRIGQILSNKPQDRRAVIEEAAGITKFKMRKRLAEAKLEGAKQNLARVFDILEEVNRQVNSLKRQAAKTKRYGELRTEAIGYLKQVLVGRFQLVERETAKTTSELNLAKSELEKLQKTVAAEEEQQIAVVQASYAVERQLTEARKHLADLQLEAERGRSRLEFQNKQIQQIEHRLTLADQESASVLHQAAETAAELDQHGIQLSSLGEERTAARQILDEKSAERQEAQSFLAERERGLEAFRQQVLRLLSELSSLRSRLSQAETQSAGLAREKNRAQTDEQQSLNDLERIGRAKEELAAQLSTKQIDLVSTVKQRQQAEQSLSEERTALQALRQNLDRLRAEFSRVKARKDSLQDIISHRSYTTETVKRLFTGNAKGHDGLIPLGVLADFLEADPQHERAAEEFLHEELEYVVVRDWADAEQGIALLRNGLEGRATFLVQKPDVSEAAEASFSSTAKAEGVVCRLIDALRFNHLSRASLSLLPRVAKCFLVSSREAAQQLTAQFPDCWFLAPDGVSYHGFSISGGKKTGVGPLALKRELREISQLEKARQQDLVSTEQQAAEVEHNISSLMNHLEGLRQQQQQQEKEVLAFDHETRKLAEEHQRVGARLSSARLEMNRVSREHGKLEELLASTRSELEKRELAKAEKEEALEDAREQWGNLQLDLARITEEHSALRAKLASFEERHRSLLSLEVRLQTRSKELEHRRNNLAQDKQRLSAERDQLRIDNAELMGKGTQLEENVGVSRNTVQQLSTREVEQRTQISRKEEGLKLLRHAVHEWQETRSALQVTLARLESDLQHLDENSRNELQQPVREIAAELRLISEENELAELDNKYQELRRKIEGLGPINPQALEEFEEAEHRQNFLNVQRQDLIDSIRDTEKAIQDLDRESRKRFTEAFHLINENFKEIFKTLFGGGIAEMRLTDEENVSESGIDIVASPPGKRLQSVLLLSGGEKALTAMALLMAVFQYTPSPFCILDEVDAPLDEPNIQRLTRLLHTMAEQTQFIVITHSKRTMEAAQALYGVTMQEPGVSRLVSVKFNSTGAEIAGRNTAEKNNPPSPFREFAAV